MCYFQTKGTYGSCSEFPVVPDWRRRANGGFLCIRESSSEVSERSSKPEEALKTGHRKCKMTHEDEWTEPSGMGDFQSMPVGKELVTREKLMGTQMLQLRPIMQMTIVSLG